MYTLSYHAKSRASFYFALLFSGALSVTGCASTESQVAVTDVSAPVVTPVDPYEGFNRSMYGFNMGLDKYLLKPVADGYKFITPNFMQTGVTNFFNNLKGINVVLNDLLQGKFEQSASDLGRFTTNSTIGLLGLFDVATDLGLQQNVEDFGQTLAVWGVNQGPYLVLPVLGPTTLRDGG
ncbi:MAG: VacJ family lipoprotein, partial [Methylomonas sp.]|nr:VacJ family lipoprotein [Methylomonas sp.]